jgi:hypothetical protein
VSIARPGTRGSSSPAVPTVRRLVVFVLLFVLVLIGAAGVAGLLERLFSRRAQRWPGTTSAASPGPSRSDWSAGAWPLSCGGSCGAGRGRRRSVPLLPGDCTSPASTPLPSSPRSRRVLGAASQLIGLLARAASGAAGTDGGRRGHWNGARPWPRVWCGRPSGRGTGGCGSTLARDRAGWTLSRRSQGSVFGAADICRRGRGCPRQSPRRGACADWQMPRTWDRPGGFRCCSRSSGPAADSWCGGGIGSSAKHGTCPHRWPTWLRLSSVCLAAALRQWPAPSRRCSSCCGWYWTAPKT